MNKARYAATIIVTLAVAAISYTHIYSIALSHGNAPFVSALYPLTIDGVIAASTLTLIQRVGVSKTTRTWATVGRYFGFAATIYANAVHSGWASTDDVIINTIPGVALIITLEVLVHAAKGTPATRARRTASKASSPAKLKAVK